MTSKKLTPIQAIKKYCKEQCCNLDRESWVHCSVEKCALFPYRLGRRPKTQPFQEYQRKLPDSALKNAKVGEFEEGMTPEVEEEEL